MYPPLVNTMTHLVDRNTLIVASIVSPGIKFILMRGEGVSYFYNNWFIIDRVMVILINSGVEIAPYFFLSTNDSN